MSDAIYKDMYILFTLRPHWSKYILNEPSAAFII